MSIVLPSVQERDQGLDPIPFLQRMVRPWLNEKVGQNRYEAYPHHPTVFGEVRASGSLPRSFRTLRLCTVPGVSPRAGMRRPVGAHRTPHLPRAPTPPRLQRPHASNATHLVNDDYFFSWATITTPLRDRLPSNPAAAGPGRSELRNVDTLIPLARQRDSPAGPNVPCERRTGPAEPPSRHGSPAPAPALSPSTRPRQSATAPRGYKAPHRCTCLLGPSDLEKQRGLNPMERIFGQVFQDDQKTEGSSRRPDPKKQQRALG